MQYTLDELRAGVLCESCGRIAKLRWHTLNSAQASWLITLVKMFEDAGTGDFIHLMAVAKADSRKDDTTSNIGSFQKLKHWGLIEAEPNKDDPKKRTKGRWRPTQKGIDFVKGKAKAAKRAEIYNDTCYQLDTRHVTIEDALKHHFDYSRDVLGIEPQDDV